MHDDIVQCDQHIQILSLTRDPAMYEIKINNKNTKNLVPIQISYLFIKNINVLYMNTITRCSNKVGCVMLEINIPYMNTITRYNKTSCVGGHH